MAPAVDTTVADLARRQDGVVSRRQLLEAGLTRTDVETLLRRRGLVPLHPGVYVTHTGAATYRQRCWAAVLHAWPAALTLRHALPDPPQHGPVDVAITWSRRVATCPGVRVHRMRHWDDLVQLQSSPPRLRLEPAALLTADRAASDLDAIAVLTGVVGARRTTAARLSLTVTQLPRLHRRALIVGLVGDLADGTHSVLEHGFVTRVLRPHRLPLVRQQAPVAGPEGREYRDVAFRGVDAHVELDGRTHDTNAQRGADADRDLADLAAGIVTPRLRWQQVYGSPCRTALLLATVLQRQGWRGEPAPCAPGCDVARSGKRVPPSAGLDSPISPVRPTR